MLAEFLDMDRNLVVNLHVQSLDQLKAIKTVKGKVTHAGAQHLIIGKPERLIFLLIECLI